DILTGRGLVFVACEHSSASLASKLRESATLETAAALQVVAQILRALCYLNSLCLVHGALDAETVLLKGDVSSVLVTGHGLGHLMAYGRLGKAFGSAQDPVCTAPELGVKMPSSQPDVWSLGILLLQMLQGRWSDGRADPSHCRVALETSAGLWRLKGERGATAQEVLSQSEEALSPSLHDLQDLAASYRRWLFAEDVPCRDFWEVCLTLRPHERPTPRDLASHPRMAHQEVRASENSGWGRCFLRCARLETPGGMPKVSEARRFLSAKGIEISQLSYWWRLMGCSPFHAAAARNLLRPRPPVLRLPLLVRDLPDEAEDTEAEDGERREVGLEQQRDAFWDPPETALGFLELELTGLCEAFQEVEDVAPKKLRPECLYDRHKHFGYQWLRVRQFQRLIAQRSQRPELIQEASQDVPPLLRAEVWSALLGSDLEVDGQCWTPSYEKLLVTPLRGTVSGDTKTGSSLQRSTGVIGLEDEQWKTAVKSRPMATCSEPSGLVRRLERLLHALLVANVLHEVEGLGAFCAVVAGVFTSEAAAFMAGQRLLHGFLWPFYGPSGPLFRHQNLRLFESLLSFADPELALHLSELGMRPETYAKD
ncbi:unnamed protein product, partial [Effrenium voratum]